MNKVIARISAIAMLLTQSTLFGAIRHTPAQAAYFEAHAKCVKQLRQAKMDASSKDPAERSRLIHTAKEEYRRCEAQAHLIWKYYPAAPPQEPPPPSPSSLDTPSGKHSGER